MSNKLHNVAAQIIEGIRAGKIDVEAGRDAISRIEMHMKHEQAMKNRSLIAIPGEDHISDAFEYGVGVLGSQDVNRGRTKPTPWDKLCMRMDWDLIGVVKKRQMELFSSGGYVFVMGVVNGEPFTIKDDENLFPSDQVVTQLRLLYNGD